MTTEQLEELKQLAEAALKTCAYDELIAFSDRANPSAIRDLIRQLEEAQAENDRLRKVLRHSFIGYIKERNERTYSPSDDSEFPQHESGVFLDDVESALAKEPK